MRTIWEWLLDADIPGGVPHILWMITDLIMLAAIIRLLLK